MLSFLRKLLPARVAKVEVKSPSSTPIQEKMLDESVCSVAPTETLTEDITSGREYEPLLFSASDGEDFNINKSKELLTCKTELRADDTMKADGSSKDWQDEVDWDSPKEPTEEWVVEW